MVKHAWEKDEWHFIVLRLPLPVCADSKAWAVDIMDRRHRRVFEPCVSLLSCVPERKQNVGERQEC